MVLIITKNINFFFFFFFFLLFFTFLRSNLEKRFHKNIKKYEYILRLIFYCILIMSISMYVIIIYIKIILIAIINNNN